MNIKNFFWVFHSPADEREVSLMQKAYGRAFMALAIGVIAIIVALGYGEFSIAQTIHSILGSINVARMILIIILLVSHISGWSAVMKEDAFDLPQSTPLRLGQVCLVYGTISLASILIAIVIPSLRIILIPVIIAIYEITIRIFAWKYSSKIAGLPRIACMLYAPGFLLFFATKKSKSMVRRVLGAILRDIVLTIIIAIPLVILSAMSVPVFVDTSAFEPVLHKEGYYSVNIFVPPSHLHVGEYVAVAQYKGSTTQLPFIGPDLSDASHVTRYIGKIISIDGDNLSLQTSAGIVEISNSSNNDQSLSTRIVTISPHELLFAPFVIETFLSSSSADYRFN